MSTEFPPVYYPEHEDQNEFRNVHLSNWSYRELKPETFSSSDHSLYHDNQCKSDLTVFLNFKGYSI